MRSTGLRVLVAVIALAVIALWLWLRHLHADTLAVARSPSPTASPDAVGELASVASARESAQPAATLPAEAPLSFGASAADAFDYDLTVIPIDDRGHPLAGTKVRIGLEMHALAELGETEWNGELHAKWRGLEPTLDLVLEARRDDKGTSTLRHVRLTAGRAEEVRLALEKRSIPILGDLNVLNGAFLEHENASTLDGGVEFTRDDAGIGVFVDPTLVREPVHPVDMHSSMPGGSMQPVLLLVTLSSAAPIDFELPKNESAVDITAVDESGAPIRGAQLEVLHRSGGGGTDSSNSGHVRLGTSAGPVRVIAGGGQHAIVWQDIEVEKGETRIVRLLCPKLDRTRVRLLDGEHQPLGGWHLESRDAGPDGAIVDAAETDAQGRAEIVIDASGRTALLVHPNGASAMPKMRLDTRSLDPGIVNDIVLDQEAKNAQLVATILTDDARIEARLWNLDTDEGMRVPVLDGSKDEGAAPGRRIRADVLVPGTYMLEIGAPCAKWKRVGPFRIAGGQALDAGTYTLDPPATVKVNGIAPKTSARVSVRKLEHGLWLIADSSVSSDDDTRALTPGEWTLSVKTSDSETPKILMAPRSVKVESGHALVLDELHPDASTPTTGSMPR